MISYGLPLKNQDKSNWGEPGQDEATPMNDGESIFNPFWGDGLQGVGLQVGQGVGRGSRYWGQSTAIDSGADSLRKVGGKEALIVWDFLEMLPLPEFSN